MATDDIRAELGPQTQTQETAGARQYSVVFVGDLGAGERLPGLTAIDKDDFAAVLSRARPTLAMAMKNPFGGGDDWEFSLSFDAMRVFDPAGFLAQVPQARWRLGVREKLIARQTAEISEAEFQQAAAAAAGADASLAWIPTVLSGTGSAAVQSPPAPAAPAGGSVLDQVDEPDAQARVAAEVSRLAAEAGGASRISGGESARLAQVLARLDRELAQIADGVLKHADFRRVESAWRGAKFLVDRADFRAGVRMSLLHATREVAVDRLVEHCIQPAFNGEIRTPALLVFDFSLSGAASDYELFDYLAQHAASLPAPAAFGVEASFFNVKSLRLLKNLPNFSGLIGGWEFAKWRTLREKPYSKSLVPVLGRFVLRRPHEPCSGAKEFTCAERIESISDVTWGGGHLALAACAMRAFAKYGWPTRMFGAEAGKIEDLAVIDNPTDAQSPWGPGDLTLPDARIDELPAIGMNLLQSVKGKDHCMLLGGVTAARPVVTQDVGAQDALLEVSLPYQQFSNVLSSYLCENMSSLHGRETSDIQARLLGGLAALLKIKPDEDPEAIQVGVGDHPEEPGRKIVQVRVTPPGTIAPGGLHIDFGFAV